MNVHNFHYVEIAQSVQCPGYWLDGQKTGSPRLTMEPTQSKRYRYQSLFDLGKCGQGMMLITCHQVLMLRIYGAIPPTPIHLHDYLQHFPRIRNQHDCITVSPAEPTSLATKQTITINNVKLITSYLIPRGIIIS